MWAITNTTPLSADRAWVRDRDGSEVWLVAVKGTFLIRENGKMKLAQKQEPVCLAPVYMGKPGASSLRYDFDLVHRKLGTDVLVHGHALAPQSRAATRVSVGFRVADITKELIVFGSRFWRSSAIGMVMTDPEPFERIPVVWERAFGGSADPQRQTWDPRNPVGTGYVEKRTHADGIRLPNVEHPSALIRSWRDRPPPGGFGPIDRHWPPRAKYAGTYDEAWQNSRKPLVPEDFDDRYYQCAPPDQQTRGFLRGGEQMEIWNMTPGGRLSFQLPRIAVSFQTFFSDGSVEHHRGQLLTVVAEPFVPRVIMIWQSRLPCHHKVLKLMETRVTTKRWINPQGPSLRDYYDSDEEEDG